MPGDQFYKYLLKLAKIPPEKMKWGILLFVYKHVLWCVACHREGS